MSHKFELSEPESISNAFKLIGKGWMLLTAGKPDSWNTMTCSWGGLGVMWNRNVCFVFVRPTRHTFSFMEKGRDFTLSFFGEEYRKALQTCGSVSGRDSDKAKLTGLTPIAIEGKYPSFSEASAVIACKSLYSDFIEPKYFLDPEIESNYKDKDYHKMYFGEILSVWKGIA